MTGKQCDRRAFSLTVNGEPKTVLAHPMERLLDVLREHLGLTGAKEGCGEGECGACAVLMDGALVDSCLIPVLQAAARMIVTIENLSGDPRSAYCSTLFLNRRRAVRHSASGTNCRKPPASMSTTSRACATCCPACGSRWTRTFICARRVR